VTASAPIAFVTGGTGFVGSHLVEALLERGYAEVRCLVRSDPRWLEKLDVRRIRGSLDDELVLERALRGVDFVYHVAGLTRATGLEPLVRSNVLGTLKLMRAVERANPGVRKVLVTSSLAAVGTAETRVADETTPMRPISLYGESKAQMERALEKENWFERIPTVIVRPPAVYGPRESDILTFFKSVSRGFCPVVGSGTRPEISLVHVSDLVSGMILAAESPTSDGELYYLGSEDFYSWHAVRDAAANVMGRRIVTVHVPPVAVPLIGSAAEWYGRLTRTYPALNREKAREILDAVKMCSVEKAMSGLGFRQRVDLETGVAETIEWYRQHGMLRQ
jgi:nucleoside-diphosphate-sugar epimerase